MLTEYFSGGIVVSCPLPKYAVTFPLSSAASGSSFYMFLVCLDHVPGFCFSFDRQVWDFLPGAPVYVCITFRPALTVQTSRGTFRKIILHKRKIRCLLSKNRYIDFVPLIRFPDLSFSSAIGGIHLPHIKYTEFISYCQSICWKVSNFFGQSLRY